MGKQEKLTTQVDEPQAVELEDDDDLELGLDHEMDDAFVVRNGDPNYHYFLAANDPTDKDRHDGVFKCKLAGYEECTEEYATGGSDCILLRLPMKKFKRRRLIKRRARESASQARREAITGVPDDVVMTVGSSQVPKVRVPGRS